MRRFKANSAAGQLDEGLARHFVVFVGTVGLGWPYHKHVPVRIL